MRRPWSVEEIVVAGVAPIADLAGALYWPDKRLLIVSGLHRETGSAFERTAAEPRENPCYKL